MKEIERKFKVINDSWKKSIDKTTKIVQSYLTNEINKSIRIRIAGENAFLTIKGATNNISRDEFEYEIPMKDAQQLLAGYCLANPIEKMRYSIQFGGLEWTIDVFSGMNEGLLVAEVELESENQKIEIPDWAGEELSNDERYYNAYLSRKPFTEWT
jgi:adenylate cyclase